MRVKGHEESGQTVGGASAHVRDGTLQSILPSLMWHHDVRPCKHTTVHVEKANGLLIL